MDDLMSFDKYIEESILVLNQTREVLSGERLQQVVQVIADALSANRVLLVCGNGGSASDAMHITGELVGRFLQERRAWKVMCLSSNPAVLTAWSNDYSFETVFSRQVEAYAEPGGVLLGLSTSGNSGNVIKAFEAGRARGMTTIAFTGEGGGRLGEVADLLIAVPSRSTPLIQQAHVCLYHYVCACVEALADRQA